MGAQRCGVARVQRPLSVIATVATRWVWIPGAAPDVDQLDKAIDGIRGIRVAIGSTDHGIEGFRRTHFDALATQRLLARLRSRQRVARFETVELVSLVTQDATRADQFIKRTLGEFESASPELRTAVRTLSTSNATHRGRQRGSTPTETRCCVGFLAQTSSCRSHLATTA
jgi:hypothetical protein